MNYLDLVEVLLEPVELDPLLLELPELLLEPTLDERPDELLEPTLELPRVPVLPTLLPCERLVLGLPTAGAELLGGGVYVEDGCLGDLVAPLTSCPVLVPLLTPSDAG